MSGTTPPLPSATNQRVQTRQPRRRVSTRQQRRRNHQGTHRAAPHFDGDGHQTCTAKQPAFWYCIDLAFGYLQSDKFQSARPPDDKQSPKPSGRPPDDERPHELRGCNSKIPEGQPCGASAKTAQTQDTDGKGGKKEFTPWGQDQGRNFCRDFAQPRQVVRGGTAAPDANRGLPPAGSCSDRRARSAWAQILPARGEITSCGHLGRRAGISALSVGNAIGTICGWEKAGGIKYQKFTRSGTA